MMNAKCLATLLTILYFTIANVAAQQIPAARSSFYATVLNHQQIYNLSCIPSSVEMVLKYNKKERSSFYKFQKEWKEKADGTFGDFNGKTIDGITFTQQFNQPRGVGFPYDSLYSTIRKELKAGRKVIISLVSGPGMWHIWLVDHQTTDGDFVGYSRGYQNNTVLEVTNIKGLVQSMQGTDIMTYKVADKTAVKKGRVGNL